MAKDDFPGLATALDAPAHRWLTVTPSDSADLPGGAPKCIHIGGGAVTEGSIVCRDKDGNNSTFFGKQGDFLPIRPHRILSTGTTVSLNIIALY